jgi:hypothetical protein
MTAPAAIEAIVMSAVTSETKTSGKVRKVTFLLPNDDPDHPFAGMVGERLHIVALKINEDETVEPVAPPAEPKERKAWADLPPSQQAAIRCDESGFMLFLCHKPGVRIIADKKGNVDTAETVRHYCGVNSRRDLNSNQRARVLWHQLDTEYLQATGRLAHG